MDLKGRDFISTADFTREELTGLIDLAARMKAGDYAEKPLAGRSVLTTRLSATPTEQRYALPTARLTANVRTHTQMNAHHLSTPQSQAIRSAWASTQGGRSARSVRSLVAGTGEALTMQRPKAAQQSHQSAEATSEREHRTTTARGPLRSNNALVSDACAAALRASYSAPQRER